MFKGPPETASPSVLICCLAATPHCDGSVSEKRPVLTGRGRESEAILHFIFAIEPSGLI